MRILLWNLYEAWTRSFVNGRHTYLVARNQQRDADGQGCDPQWPVRPNVSDVALRTLKRHDVDLVVLQRPREIAFVRHAFGLEPGRRVPAVYVEHHAPAGPAGKTEHWLSPRADIPVVHTSHFNNLLWDCGLAPTAVIEPGVADPGYRFIGQFPRLGSVIREPRRRGRVSGADLLRGIARVSPVDLYGADVPGLASDLGAPPIIEEYGVLPRDTLHDQLAQRRAYVYLARWGGPGHTVIDVMMLGIPIVGVGTGGLTEAVPPDAGTVSNDQSVLTSAVKQLNSDRELGCELGWAARSAALNRFSLKRFLADWDDLLESR